MFFIFTSTCHSSLRAIAFVVIDRDKKNVSSIEALNHFCSLLYLFMFGRDVAEIRANVSRMRYEINWLFCDAQLECKVQRHVWLLAVHKVSMSLNPFFQIRKSCLNRVQPGWVGWEVAQDGSPALNSLFQLLIHMNAGIINDDNGIWHRPGL